MLSYSNKGPFIKDVINFLRFLSLGKPPSPSIDDVFYERPLCISFLSILHGHPWQTVIIRSCLIVTVFIVYQIFCLTPISTTRTFLFIKKNFKNFQFFFWKFKFFLSKNRIFRQYWLSWTLYTLQNLYQ